MHQPTRPLATIRIPVRPMNEALEVPRIGSKQGDHVTSPERVDARRKISVASYQERLARGKSQNEPLVTTTVIAVRQELLDIAFTRNLETTHLFGVGSLKFIARGRRQPLPWRRGPSHELL